MQQTPSQKLAIESIDKPTAIIAGAGSGKTEVLTQRLLHILKSGKVGLNQILAITFTEKAAGELKRRIAFSLSDSKKSELPWANIGTFHGFCLNFLKEQAALVGFSEGASVWDEHTAKLAIHRHCRHELLQALERKDPHAILLTEELEFRHALMLQEELMHFRWHAERHLQSKSSDPEEEKLLEATRILYKQILESYAEEKRERQVFDFQDLEIKTLDLLHQHKEVLKTYQQRFAHILIDEAQDINDLQRELVGLLFAPTKNYLCVVGDPKQSIYRFRGANVRGFQMIVDRILKSGGHGVQLKENFRSRPPILKFINHTFEHLFSPQEHSPLLATRKETDHPSLELLSVDGENKTSKEDRRKIEAERMAQYVQSYVQQSKGHFGDVALLFQSLIDVRHYERAFRSLHIPYRLFGGRGFLNAQEVIDLLFCLKLMVEPENRLALVGLMRSPLIGLTDIHITKLSLEHSNDLGQALLELPEANWLKELANKKHQLSAAEILSEAAFQTHYDCLVHQLDPSGTKLANIEQFIELTRRLETGEEMSLAELLEYFEELKKRRSPMASASAVDTSSDACQLMTVHAAKGLQFPVVILPDLLRSPPVGNHRYLFIREEGLGFYLRESPNPFSEYIPSMKTNELKEKEKYQDLQERKRLLYVALTRAQEKLVIPWHEEVRQAGPWYAWLKEAIESFENIFSWDEKKVVGDSREGVRGLPCGSQGGPFGETDPSAWQAPLLFSPAKKDFPYLAVTKLGTLEKKTTETAKFKETQNGIQGAQLGNIVHGVLKQTDPTKTLSLDTLLKKVLFEQNIFTNEDEFQSIFNLVDQFLNSDIAPPTWEGFHELPFRLKLPNAIITGIIDYAWETKEGWVLADFKTDSQFEPQKYQLQMDIYALALSKGMSKPVLETQLLFLKAGKAKIEVCNPARLEKTEERLLNLINSLKVNVYDQ